MTRDDRSGKSARWVEPALALLIFAIIALSEGPRAPIQWALALLVCGGAALAGFRPRTAAFVTGVALLGFLTLPVSSMTSVGIAVFVNIFALTRHRPRGWLWLIGLLLAVVYWVMVVHFSLSTSDTASSLVVLAVLLAISGGGGLLWRIGEQRVVSVREAAEEEVVLLRRSLARDLHDTVAHTISNAAMRAHMAGLDPTITPALRIEFEQIATDCSTAAQDLRQLLTALRDLDGTSTSSTGPLADVRSLGRVVEEQTDRLRRAGFTVESRVDLTAPVRASRAGAMSMIVVEAVNNMLKHARPSGICEISIHSDASKLAADFRNQMDAQHPPSRGLGLIGIRERANLLNGSCAYGERDGWWLVEVLLPLGNESLTGEVPRRSAIG